jgi:hypothetical protein
MTNDQVERLRAERDAWEATANHHYSEAFTLRAERDALRDRILTALDAISDGNEAGAHLILYEGKRQINAARKP